MNVSEEKPAGRVGCFLVQSIVAGDSRETVCKAVCERDGFGGVAVGTVVALKLLSVDSGDRDYEAQFERRIAELKGLSHPSIAKCFGSFCEKGPFGDMRVIVREWLEGESLGERLRCSPNGLDADEALRIGGRLLDALAYISSKGVVLGSVQPDHILLCKDGSVKIVDFEYPVQQKPCMPTVCPSLNYTAPEFLNAEFRGDERSDIFSFGVCFHEMLSGRLPYAEQSCTPTIAEFLERWHSGDNAPITIRPLVKRILSGASEVLKKALRAKREERYATFTEFVAAFKGIRCRELSHEDNTWRLLQYVGTGEFGEVFKARDVKTGQVVAIRCLPHNAFMDYSRTKARVLAQPNDSSIVRFVAFFEQKTSFCKQAFLVMEYLDGMPGQSLRDDLKRADGKPLQRNLVIRAFARYAHGLSILHAEGFVHRGIRPANLYFPKTAADRAALMDFAIVRDVEAGMVAVFFSEELGYLPPEVFFVGRSCDDARNAGMDIYALGLSLYEALTGGKTAYPRLPREAAARMVFLRARTKTRPNLDESSYSDMPDLVRLVREMTEPDVAKRLKDVAEVERRLNALLEASSVGGGAAVVTSRSERSDGDCFPPGVVLARSKLADISIPERFVSGRKHVKIFREGGGVYAVNFGLYGTWVNGENIGFSTPHLLHVGDILKIGPAEVRIVSLPEEGSDNMHLEATTPTGKATWEVPLPNGTGVRPEMTSLEKMILLRIPADYSWSEPGIVRMGEKRDIAASAVGDFRGKCLIFCHGNGETAVSERHWFEKLAEAGVSVVCPDYRGYGLSEGALCEQGCYEAAHAAYAWLVDEKGVSPSRITVLGYSLGSAVAVELATTVPLASLILQTPFLGGAELRPVWERLRGLPPSSAPDTSFPTSARLPLVQVPTLVIHGTADSVVPFEQGKAVFERIASKAKKFVPVEGADHCTFQYFLGEHYVPTLVDFISGRRRGWLSKLWFKWIGRIGWGRLPG